jgi:formyltetrahydrofolate deformylase
VRSRLVVSCPDQPGIVAAVAGFLFDHGANILSSAQHSGERFFLRMEFEHESALPGFDDVAQRFAMAYGITPADRPKQVAILVSREEHCLLDLLWRTRSGELDMEVPVVISNHEDARGDVESFGVPFAHVPNTPARRPEAEEAMLEAIAEKGVDLVVLARYMQILTSAVVGAYPNRIINIHHSFLPAFVGANPYRQAHDRGVKLIGATAHYVTAALDEGPIIEQEVVRATHRDDIERLAQRSRDLESVVLARAVRAHLERRVLVYGTKTVVFS